MGDWRLADYLSAKVLIFLQISAYFMIICINLNKICLQKVVLSSKECKNLAVFIIGTDFLYRKYNHLICMRSKNTAM